MLEKGAVFILCESCSKARTGAAAPPLEKNKNLLEKPKATPFFVSEIALPGSGEAPEPRQAF